MKFNKTVQYAIVSLQYMAQQGKTTPLASHIIAGAVNVPERFLLKILKPLVNNQILRSTKGPNGGYSLVKDVSKVTLLEIVESLDGPLNGSCESQILDGVASQLCNLSKKHLGNIKLSDLFKEHKGKNLSAVLA